MFAVYKSKTWCRIVCRRCSFYHHSSFRACFILVSISMDAFFFFFPSHCLSQSPSLVSFTRYLFYAVISFHSLSLSFSLHFLLQWITLHTNWIGSKFQQCFSVKTVFHSSVMLHGELILWFIMNPCDVC